VQVDDALSTVIQEGRVLLFPIYDKLTGSGDNAQFHIIGWAAFQVTRFTANGSGGAVYGHFLRVTHEGIQVKSTTDAADYGVRVVKLVN
jgi:hypothetical protein